MSLKEALKENSHGRKEALGRPGAQEQEDECAGKASGQQRLPPVLLLVMSGVQGGSISLLPATACVEMV